MRGFDHSVILSPSFHGLPKEHLATARGRGGGVFQKNWVGVCSMLPETLTLFQTKISDFPFPISDLIKNLIWSLACDQSM